MQTEGRRTGIDMHSYLKTALLLTAGAVACAQAAEPVVQVLRPTALPAGRMSHTHTNVRLGIDERVAIYAKALGLDDSQQSRLKALLLDQRQQVQRLWNDTSMSPAQRVYTTRAIGDATADAIRAMLTEEQRKKY